MGHEIKYFTYKGNDTDAFKRDIERQLNEYVAARCIEEGAGGLLHPIRWIDKLFDSHDEAMDYIKAIDNVCNYDQIAVKYRVVEQPKKQSAALTKLFERQKKATAELEECWAKDSIKNSNTEYIGCTKCGSRLKRELIRGEYCPLCHTDLRRKTALEKINKCERKLADIHEKIAVQKEQEYRAALASGKAKVDVNWLVKIEFHQ